MYTDLFTDRRHQTKAPTPRSSQRVLHSSFAAGRMMTDLVTFHAEAASTWPPARPQSITRPAASVRSCTLAALLSAVEVTPVLILGRQPNGPCTWRVSSKQNNLLVTPTHVHQIRGYGPQRPQHFCDLLHASTQHEKQQTKFVWWSNWMRGKFVQGNLNHARTWPKFLVTRMLMLDLFAIANLAVKIISLVDSAVNT